MLSALGDAGQAVAALVAIVGIPLAVRQFSLQTRMAQIDLMREMDDRYTKRFARVGELLASVERSKSERISDDTIEIINEIVSQVATLKLAIDHPSAGASTRPLLAIAFWPAQENLSINDEEEYRSILKCRCRVAFKVLDTMLASDSPAVQRDLLILTRTAVGLSTNYDNSAQLLELGLVPPWMVIGKRHLTIVREIYLLEPLLIWMDTRRKGHRRIRTLRTLALGIAARTFTWGSPLHAGASIGIELPAISLSSVDDSFLGPIITTRANKSSRRPRLSGRKLRRLARSIPTSQASDLVDWILRERG